MQEYVEDNPITFNDIPRVMSDILKNVIYLNSP